ncbi:MAG: hypothetical protein JW881_08625 [Spirochaetales bacterium]|nr:hypothetical protein [Spirochaetales bacterium]
MEKQKDLLVSNFEKVKKAVEPLFSGKETLPPLAEEKDYSDSEFASYGIFLSRFGRAIEIVVHIFFKIVEVSEFGAISNSEEECIANMRKLGLVSDPDIWLEIIEAHQSLLAYCSPVQKISICNDIMGKYMKEIEYFLKKCEIYL